MSYCDEDCQKEHWKRGHKKRCKKPAQAVTVVPNGEYPGMFPLITENIPKIDEMILSYLSPADIAKIKLVNKRWYALAHKNMRVYAEIVAPPVKEDDLVGVRIHVDSAQEWGFRTELGNVSHWPFGVGFVARDKLVFVPDSDTVRVCRMAAKGEKGFYGGKYQVRICTT